MDNKTKKKITSPKFFLIYVLALASILLAVVIFNGVMNTGNLQKIESTQNLDATSIPAGNQDQPSPTAEPTTNPDLPLSGLTVVIDAGHQENPPEGKESYMPWDESKTKAKNTHGTTGQFTGIEEYVVNLEIALKVRDTLQKQGATVVMTRDNHGTSLSNQERAGIANNSNAQIAISIHCNGSDNPNVSGAESYTRDKGDGTAEYKARSASDLALSQSLINSVCASTGAKNRGAKLSDAHTGINYSKIPFIILECGFMSNESEDRLLSTADYQQKIADGIYNFLKDNKSSII